MGDIPILSIEQLVKFREKLVTIAAVDGLKNHILQSESESQRSQHQPQHKQNGHVTNGQHQYQQRGSFAVEEVARCDLPIQLGNSDLGTWDVRVFLSKSDRNCHTVLIKGDISSKTPVLTRIHSECFTGNTLGSMRCDCGQQFHRSLEIINDEGCGVVIWVTGHEGRGIGLVSKIKAYNLQTTHHLDTYQANSALGFPLDMRTYQTPLEILKFLGISKIELLTNNPHKLSELMPITAMTRSLVCGPNEHNRRYLEAKRNYERTMQKKLQEEHQGQQKGQEQEQEKGQEKGHQDHMLAH